MIGGSVSGVVLMCRGRGKDWYKWKWWDICCNVDMLCILNVKELFNECVFG